MVILGQCYFGVRDRAMAFSETYEVIIMKAFIVALRVLAAAFVAVACLHLFLGLGADATLGVQVPPDIARDPSFDSQNRFYGVTFALLGVVLFIAATDLTRYRAMVLAVLGVLFMAGIARAVAWMLHGAPAPGLIGILVADFVLPPVLYLWFGRVTRNTA